MERFPRVAAALLALGCLALLAVAAGLTPSGAGHGTHEDLGLEPCGFLATTGFPCATCGMTTAFAHAAEGQYVQSFHTQPFGAALAVSTAALFWLAAHAAITGSRLADAASGFMSQRVIWLVLGALVAAWVYKIITMAG